MLFQLLGWPEDAGPRSYPPAIALRIARGPFANTYTLKSQTRYAESSWLRFWKKFVTIYFGLTLIKQHQVKHLYVGLRGPTYLIATLKYLILTLPYHNLHSPYHFYMPGAPGMSPRTVLLTVPSGYSIQKYQDLLLQHPGYIGNALPSFNSTQFELNIFLGLCTSCNTNCWDNPRFLHNIFDI